MKSKKNPYRIIFLVILIVMLSGLMIFGAKESPWLSLDECMENPARYDGQLVTHVSEPQVGKIKADGFYLKSSNRPDIFVYADTAGLITGEYLGIIGHFHKEGYLTAHTIFTAEHRRYKILFSTIPAVLTIGLFFGRFGWHWKRFQFEGRAHA